MNVNKMRTWLELIQEIKLDKEIVNKILRKEEIDNESKIKVLAKFCMTFMLFNEIYKDFEGNERNKIKNFVICLEKYREGNKILGDLKNTNYFKILKEELENNELKNLTRQNREIISAKDLEENKKLFEAIYIIRCNLFHGDKIKKI